MLVSVVMPVKNEIKYIELALNSLFAQDYPKELIEIICVDGMSDDGTREILKTLQHIHPNLRTLDNSKRITPAALNIGILASSGEIVIRVDAHSSYPKNYITSLVSCLIELKADNVGGVCTAVSKIKSRTTDSIIDVLTSWFGVGNSLFRLGVADIREVDTVPFGCYRKSIFEKIGYFNEQLYRTEDYEFNQRLRSLGGRIYLIPKLVIHYFVVQTYFAFAKKQYNNGFGVLDTAVVQGKIKFLAIRHLVPLGFVIYCAMLPVLQKFIWNLSYIPASLYLLCLISAGFRCLVKTRDPVTATLSIYAHFLTHFSYGLGSLCSLVDAPRRLIQKKRIFPFEKSLLRY